MKFFVSGRFDDTHNVRMVIDALIAHGHSITHDWTQSDTLLGGTAEKLNNTAESGMRAQDDINGVLDADVYVLLSNNATVGKGMYVELGAALAAHQLHKRPKVYVIGPRNHLSVFYLHPTVIHKNTIEDVLTDLGS